jgi:hypothetical protein
VIFLDELSLYRRDVLEALRPLERSCLGFRDGVPRSDTRSPAAGRGTRTSVLDGVLEPAGDAGPEHRQSDRSQHESDDT